MIETIVFDVDDTIYDQQQPFKNAVIQALPWVDENDFSAFYIRFRFHSDETFTKAMSNEWTMEHMRFYRTNEALKDLGYAPISQEIGVAFQKAYEEELDKITMHPEIKKVLDYLLSKKISMGIITNGPTDHQYKKIKQMNLEQWIPTDNIIISQSTGFQKPDKEIFYLAAKQFKMNPKTTLYIGDNFENDVLGAANGGWHALWFNHRLRKISSKIDAPHLEEIQTFEELLPYIKMIF